MLSWRISYLPKLTYLWVAYCLYSRHFGASLSVVCPTGRIYGTSLTNRGIRQTTYESTYVWVLWSGFLLSIRDHEQPTSVNVRKEQSTREITQQTSRTIPVQVRSRGRMTDCWLIHSTTTHEIDVWSTPLVAWWPSLSSRLEGVCRGLDTGF
jgi:hypothetical protein